MQPKDLQEPSRIEVEPFVMEWQASLFSHAFQDAMIADSHPKLIWAKIIERTLRSIKNLRNLSYRVCRSEKWLEWLFLHVLMIDER
jgi:hypothetical protein